MSKTKKRKQVKQNDEQNDETVFERQQEAWFENNCQGNIEDYD